MHRVHKAQARLRVWLLCGYLFFYGVFCGVVAWGGTVLQQAVNGVPWGLLLCGAWLLLTLLTGFIYHAVCGFWERRQEAASEDAHGAG